MELSWEEEQVFLYTVDSALPQRTRYLSPSILNVLDFGIFASSIFMVSGLYTHSSSYGFPTNENA